MHLGLLGPSWLASGVYCGGSEALCAKGAPRQYLSVDPWVEQDEEDAFRLSEGLPCSLTLGGGLLVPKLGE